MTNHDSNILLQRFHPAMVFAFLFIGSAIRADDWPQYRGPNRDGAWNETGILEKFPADGLKYRWRVAVAQGFSSPVVANGRVYVTDVILAKPRADERVLCFDEVTGQSLWTFVYEVKYPDWAFGREEERSGPTSTPIVQEGKVYTLGLEGDLICLDAIAGKVIWRTNVETEFHVQEFSFNASLLIEGDLLILSIGSLQRPQDSCVVALDKKSGKTIWKTPDDGLTNSSPIVISSGGKRQLIVWTTKSVIALDPATGSTYWKEPENLGTGYAVATPILKGDLLLVGGIMLKLQADRPAASTLWPAGKGSRGRVLSNTSTGLLQGDHVYSAMSSGQLICLEAGTGKQLWEDTHVTSQQSGSSIHITPNGSRVFLFTDQGNLILARLSPEGYTEISRARLIEPTFPFGGKKRSWTPPAFANRHVFARTDKELVCASLAATEGK